MGKTTIKKVIFEKENPNDLILFPLESTIVLKYSVYDFMDLKLSLLDTAGQSFPIYLNNKDRNIFEEFRGNNATFPLIIGKMNGEGGSIRLVRS